MLLSTRETRQMASFRTGIAVLHISFPTFSNKRYGFNGFHSNPLLGVTDSSFGLKLAVLTFSEIWLCS